MEGFRFPLGVERTDLNLSSKSVLWFQIPIRGRKTVLLNSSVLFPIGFRFPLGVERLMTTNQFIAGAAFQIPIRGRKERKPTLLEPVIVVSDSH